MHWLTVGGRNISELSNCVVMILYSSSIWKSILSPLIFKLCTLDKTCALNVKIIGVALESYREIALFHSFLKEKDVIKIGTKNQLEMKEAMGEVQSLSKISLFIVSNYR